MSAVATKERRNPTSAPPERDDAARQLAASFKEARAVLDELERIQEGLLDDMARSDEPHGSVPSDQVDPSGQPSLEE